MAADTPDVVALVPMKPVAEAKSRLWPDVPPDVRQAAAALMLERVVCAAVQALGPHACRVVGGDTLVQRIAADAEADWQPERGRDLNSSLWLAMQAAYNEGHKAALFLPSDLPQATAEDILRVVEASEGSRRPCGVAAERDGGTNALLVPAATAFAPLLGKDSFARHREAAQRQGTPLVEVAATSLALDVDTAGDLAWAREHVPGFESGLAEWRERLMTKTPR